MSQPLASNSQIISSHGVFLRRVRAYGPGIEPTGPIVGAPANFTVETFSAGKGNVDVIVDDPKGNKLPVRIFANKYFTSIFTYKYACNFFYLSLS